MKRLYSHDPEFEAWVEVPNEWLAGDYDKFQRTHAKTAALGHSDTLSRLAGVVALILERRVNADVPGLDLSGEEPDLEAIGAKALGFLILAVAVPLELSTLVPFGPSMPSENGTKPKKE